MAKVPIKKNLSLDVLGTIDVANMKIEVEDLGEFDLLDLLRDFEGKYIHLSIKNEYIPV